MKPIKDDLPVKLIEVLNSPQFDDEAGIVIESVKWDDKDITIEFSIRFDGDTPQQLWQVIACGVVEEKIISEWAEIIELYSQHVLLLEHTDTHTELYMKGKTENSNSLFIDIFQSITQLSQDIHEVSKYILYPDEVKKISNQDHGLLARGPKTVLKVYEQSLFKHGIKPIYIGEYEPSPEKRSLMLLKIGNSYCIGHTFSFLKIA